ncbi:MAG: DUF3800 domain-containing protein [Candidatus Stahlbacteria bacterium]|nr:DUF3800 domain-containing protein [Candidatus Stahlbacteria bacterium]
MIYHIYCDESRQTQDRYMVLGGIITTAKNVELFNQAMQLYRDGQNMRAEIKWGKVSDKKLSEYKALIDLFFSFNEALHFKSIVFDTSLINYKTYSSGDKELGFYKFWYQFLLHSFGAYAKKEDGYLVFMDRRQSSYSLSELKSVLNNGIRKRYGDRIRKDIFRNIQPLDSKKSNMIQLADVLMGAIGYQWNGCHTRAEARRSKILLSEYIKGKAGLISLAQPTPFSRKNFSIWQFRLSQK